MTEPESMSEPLDADGYAGRDAPKKRLLRSVAAQAAALTAAVHFLWAWPRLGEPSDPRPYVFLLGGAFTVAVAVATLRADEYRRLYALGAGTLSAFLAGYAGWHGAGAVSAIAVDPLAIVAAGAEVVGVGAFLALYRLAPPTSAVVERRTAGETSDDSDATGDSDAAGDRSGTPKEGDGA